jgi:hypothetical protein
MSIKVGDTYTKKSSVSWKGSVGWKDGYIGYINTITVYRVVQKENILVTYHYSMNNVRSTYAGEIDVNNFEKLVDGWDKPIKKSI